MNFDIKEQLEYNKNDRKKYPKTPRNYMEKGINKLIKG